MGAEERAAAAQGSALRVMRVEIPSHVLSEALFGSGIQLAWCEVVLRHMLPAPAVGTLHGVSEHGLSILYSGARDAEQPSGLLVPWSQVAYVRFFDA
jgi:hypothetical protein